MSDFAEAAVAAPALSPFEALLDYEQRSLAHVAGVPELIDAPGSWRGIAFRLGSRNLVSSIEEVQEILAFPALTTVPGTQIWLLGVANVRGNLVPVVDLRCFIEGERAPHRERSRVLLVRQAGSSVGVVVDEILGQRSFNDGNLIDDIAEEDERYQKFIPRFFDWNGTPYREFSMSALVRARDFTQAAA
ncbi:MAG: chemotaxis protein CheW [Lysobacterales bacterium]